MAIDAFTLIAQVVNFLVLLVLLRSLLFRPVQRVMAERERRIAEAHAAAERARGEAEDAAQALREEREAFVRERRERLAAVEREVDQVRGERLDALRAEVEAARDAWHAELERARRDASDALRHRAPALLAEALRSGWRDLADEALDARAVTTFARRLTELDAATRDTLATAAASGAVRVATAFEPTREQRGAITAALAASLGYEGDVAFRRDPSLVAGVALHAGDLRVGWSVEDLVTGLASAWAEVAREETESAESAEARAAEDAGAAPAAGDA